MLEWLGVGPITDHWPITHVLIRLVTATLLGGVVAWIYRSTRERSDVTPSLSATLVLLSVLIAMVTQVIGDNLARAFGLVGALSIVRFRTVVRDTEDTAWRWWVLPPGSCDSADESPFVPWRSCRSN